MLIGRDMNMPFQGGECMLLLGNRKLSLVDYWKLNLSSLSCIPFDAVDLCQYHRKKQNMKHDLLVSVVSLISSSLR